MGVLPAIYMAHEVVIFTATSDVVATFASPHSSTLCVSNHILLCWFLVICNQSDRGPDRTLIKATELWHITNKHVYLFTYVVRTMCIGFTCLLHLWLLYCVYSPFAGGIKAFHIPIYGVDHKPSAQYHTEPFLPFFLKWKMIGSLIPSESFVTHYTLVKSTRECTRLPERAVCQRYITRNITSSV